MQTKIKGTIRVGRSYIGVGGGAYTNTFTGRLVYQPGVGLPSPLFVRRSGVLACSLDQALVPVQVGDWVVTISGQLPAQLENPDVDVSIQRVISISSPERKDSLISPCEIALEQVQSPSDTEMVALAGVIPWDDLGTYHNRKGDHFCGQPDSGG